MKGQEPYPFVDDAEVHWRKNAPLVRKGFKLLAYLPPGRSAWNATLAALAFSARRQLAGRAERIRQFGLAHKRVFDALERLAGPGRPARGGLRVFGGCQATA